MAAPTSRSWGRSEKAEYLVRVVENEGVVGCHDDRATRAGGVAKCVEDDPGVVPVQVAGWLVGKDHPRVVDQRSTHGDPLRLTARDLSGEMVGAGDNPQLGQEPPSHGQDLGAR